MIGNDTFDDLFSQFPAGEPLALDRIVQPISIKSGTLQRQGCTKGGVAISSVESNEVAASLYRDHEKSLKGFVVRLVPGYQVAHAEDVVQETFVRTIKHLNSGKEVESPKGFLFTTARNLVTSMFYRGQQCMQTDSMPDMDEHTSNANVCSPEHRAMLQEKLDAFSVAIATLPTRYQEAFVRRRVWGESCGEIAVAMHLSEAAVSNYAALGWKLLLEYCEEHEIVFNDFSDQE